MNTRKNDTRGDLIRGHVKQIQSVNDCFIDQSQTVTEHSVHGIVGRMSFLNVLHQVFLPLTGEFTGSAQFGVETLGHVSRQLFLGVEFLAADGTLQ